MAVAAIPWEDTRHKSYWAGMRCQDQHLARVGEASMEMSPENTVLENTGKDSRSRVWRLQGMLQGQAGLAGESRTGGALEAHQLVKWELLPP